MIYESILRLQQPESVDQTIMLAIAALALLMNGGIMLSLHAASKDDINVRSAFVHMLGDALGSVAIMAGALIIRFTGFERVDPILSIVLACLIVWTAWDIIRESLNILLEGLPRGIDLNQVGAAMRGVGGVLNVHDLHIWSLGSSTHALSCHVLIEDVPPSASDIILRNLNHILADRYRIFHTTVQFEHVSCSISESGCAIPVSAGSHSHHHH
jgi:cobalt-zinc-cadmium efflux system protein